MHGARQILEINLGKVVRSAWTGNVSGSERMSETEKGTENEKGIETGSVGVRKKVSAPEKMRSAGRMKIDPGMTVLANGSGSVTGTVGMIAEIGQGKGTVGVIADGTERGSAIGAAVAEIARKFGIQMEADVNEKQPRIVGPSLEPWALRRMQKEEGWRMTRNGKVEATRWVEVEVEAGA